MSSLVLETDTSVVEIKSDDTHEPKSAGDPSPHLSDLIELHRTEKKPFISIEFFPPKTEGGVTSLFNTLKKLQKYNPLFCDVTWGAGGSTSSLTVEICKKAKQEYGAITNMHLTCTNMEKSMIDSALQSCKESGITNILALRGDPPAGSDAWTATEGGFTCALDLIQYIKQTYDNFFCIAAAGYPEGHMAAFTEIVVDGHNVEGALATLTPTELERYSIDFDDATGIKKVVVCKDDDFKKELDYLKRKVDAGASVIITQMFFDTNVFENFVKSCREIGILCPILPGIMCISTYGGFKRMSKFCKTRIPQSLADDLDAIKDDDAAVAKFGIDFGIKMCRRLVEMGVCGLHFYTLNQSAATSAIIDGLGLATLNIIEHAL